MANKQIEKSTFSFDVEVRMLEIFDWPKRQINSMNIFFQSHAHTPFATLVIYYTRLIL